MATSRYRLEFDIVQLLLQYGADINAHNKYCKLTNNSNICSITYSLYYILLLINNLRFHTLASKKLSFFQYIK